MQLYLHYIGHNMPYPNFKYEVKINRPGNKSTVEMCNWLISNDRKCKCDVDEIGLQIRAIIYFKYKEDAVIFSLKWA